MEKSFRHPAGSTGSRRTVWALSRWKNRRYETSGWVTDRPGASGKRESRLIDTQAVDALKDRLMNDEEIMSKITALANDPAFKELMNDPEILKAVANNDVPALLSNPKFLRAIESDRIKEIERKLGQ